MNPRRLCDPTQKVAPTLGVRAAPSVYQTNLIQPYVPEGASDLELRIQKFLTDTSVFAVDVKGVIEDLERRPMPLTKMTSSTSVLLNKKFILANPPPIASPVLGRDTMAAERISDTISVSSSGSAKNSFV